MQAEAEQTRFLLQQYERWLTGLADGHRALEPAPGAKTAGWLLGHLVVTGDFARKLCGLPPLAPREWRARFAPGTIPSPDPADYPPMHELVDTFRAIYADLAARAPTATADALAAPNPFEPARPAFPTGGSFVKYLLTGHLGYHLGQLSIWRAAAAAVDPQLAPA
jgi:hypothetical protein